MRGYTAKRLRKRAAEILARIQGPKPKNIDKQIKLAWKSLPRNARSNRAIRQIDVAMGRW